MLSISVGRAWLYMFSKIKYYCFLC